MMIQGSMYTALATPFTREGEVDYASLKKLVQFQVDKGVEGFVISGTTAESPNLSFQEVENIYTAVRAASPQGFPLILGVGTNSTSGTIERIKSFEHLDPHAYLVVTPYYNKPSQEGLKAHFSQVAESTERNIVLYDVPGRTVVEIASETVAALAQVPNIVGIKDATGRIEKLKEMQALIDDPEFVYLSGDDGTTCEFIQAGGHGVISVLSHVVPSEFKRAMAGEEDFSRYAKLCDLLFCESNPAPVKQALQQMKIFETSFLRLPLLQMSADNSALLEEELKNLGVL